MRACRWGVVLRLRGVRLSGLSASLWGEQVISYVGSGSWANPGRIPGVSQPGIRGNTRFSRRSRLDDGCPGASVTAKGVARGRRGARGGAGPAGLAVAACLRQKGIDTLVARPRRCRRRLVAAALRPTAPPHAAQSSPRCRGCGCRRVSGGGSPRTTWPSTCAATPSDTESCRGSRPRSADSSATTGHWTALTDDGDVTARQVVIATGYSCSPVQPNWPGQETFGGEVVHASEYRSPAAYVDRDVLVVGAGNTGAEIAADLAEGGAARVRLSVRTPPNVIPRQTRACSDRVCWRSRWSTPLPGSWTRSTGSSSAGSSAI